EVKRLAASDKIASGWRRSASIKSVRPRDVRGDSVMREGPGPFLRDFDDREGSGTSSGTKSFGIMMGGGGECAPRLLMVPMRRGGLVAAEICRAHAARLPLTRARRGWLPRARAVRQFPGDRGS